MTFSSAKKKLKFYSEWLALPLLSKDLVMFLHVYIYIFFCFFRNGSYVPEEGAIPIELLAPLSEEFK
jgi:hypothetical protein